MNKLIITLILLLLTGCATIEKPFKVLIPIAIHPKIDVPVRPALPICLLKEDSTPDVTLPCYVASIKILLEDDNMCREMLSQK